MGLFSKTRSDSQRMLSKGKGGNKKTLISLQLRNSSSISSGGNSYDDGENNDLAIAPPDFNSDSKTGSSKKKQKKVWRELQDDSTTPNNAYIPPGTTSIDPFATTTISKSTSLSSNTILYNQNVASSSNHDVTITGNVSTKLFAKKQFQRLNSMDDASFENMHHEILGTAKQKVITKKISSVPLLSSSSLPSASSSSKQRGKASSSSFQKNKNLLSKHTKSSSTFTKVNSCDDTTPRSSSVSDAIYYPPPTMKIVSTTTKDTTQQTAQPRDNEDSDHYPSKDFIMNVIRNSNSTGEEMFDIRSESTGSGQIRTKRTIFNENSQDVFQRCNSIESENDVYSQSVQNSAFDSDTGYPVLTTKPSINSFQQMIFDDKFQKITAITKSETGSSTYSDLAKAATQLTKVLSPEPNFSILNHATIVPQQPPPYPSSHNGHLTNLGSGTKSMNKSVAKLNMMSMQSIKKKSTSHGNMMMSSNESVDGMSYTSNHSGKSRGDYQAAIRSKTRSPIKKTHMSAATMASMGHRSTATPISVANATFSNSVRLSCGQRSDFSFDRKSSMKFSTNQDQFMMASDFNVTKFAATKEDIDDYNDPFQIGNDVVGSGSNDSAWNVATNPFPYLGSGSGSSDSQQHKFEDNHQVHHEQFQFADQVGKANSMDDALIESIRLASKSNNRPCQQDHLDPSSQEVRISHSDGDLDYAPPQHHRSGHSGGGLVGDYYYSGPNQQQLKKRTTTKGVPANAIIGSMLFRQTQTCDEYCDESELAKNTKKNSKTSTNKKRKESPKSGGLEVDEQDEVESSISNYKVPRNVHADSKSDVASSVTEEASLFYTKNLLQHNNAMSNNSTWNQQAQNILNHYNVQRNKMPGMTTTTLQSRDMNTTRTTTSATNRR